VVGVGRRRSSLLCRSGSPVGVYAGAGWSSYLLFNLASHRGLLDSEAGHQVLLGNEKDNLTTRVSYKLDFRGPSVAVQTGCSSSLVAIALACQSLLEYQCDLALAGGVSVTVPQHGYLYREAGILSPDGHCRAFDAGARGTVLGSGAGVLVLRRLDEALAEGDYIHAVIRAAALNNDGGAKAGYTAPSVDGQARVIVEALELAGITPRCHLLRRSPRNGHRPGGSHRDCRVNQSISLLVCQTEAVRDRIREDQHRPPRCRRGCRWGDQDGSCTTASTNSC